MRGFVLATLAALIACSISEPIPLFHIEQNEQLQTFKFSSCLPADKEILVVNSLVLKPDPLHLPGDLSISFNITFKKEVHSPLKAVVSLAKWWPPHHEWVRIPCMEAVGSCTYKDLCDLLSNISQCPQPLVSAGVPCHCPFQKGTYSLPYTTFSVNLPILPTGQYHGQANLTMNTETVGCYDIHATFA